MSVYPPILQRVAALWYQVFDAGAYDLNLIGIRSSNRNAGSFDDLFCVAFKDEEGIWTTHWFACTCDPGLPWMASPSREDGTAILVPGQHRSSWGLGLHRQKYEALCQRVTGKDLPVYRDGNKDTVLDMDPDSIEFGMFGINIHRASGTRIAPKVGKYSAGCIVIQSPIDFDKLIELCHKQIEHHPTWTTFSFTLLED